MLEKSRLLAIATINNNNEKKQFSMPSKNEFHQDE